MIEVTRPLARYIVASRLDGMPAQVRHEGVRAFVNSMGCVLGGCRESVIERALAVFEELSGPPQATVIGWGRRVDAPTAAMLNAMSVFVHSFMDTHLATVAHPAGPPTAALFAMSERQKVSGPDFLHALVLGIEVACRLANVIAAAPAKSHVGLSTHGVTNVIGTAVAMGKLLGLDEQKMVWAIGLAVVQAAGIRSGHGSMGGKLVAGHATRCGMLAAMLAAKGFTCSENPLEGAKGYAAVFANPPNLAAAVDRLGEHYEMLANAYKPYPCGIVIHSSIDVCLQLAAEPGFDAAAIHSVALRVHPLSVQLCDRQQPADRMQALVSVQHWAAAALLFRKAGIPEGSDRVVHDPAVAALRGRIAVRADERVASEAAKATVVFKDGSTRQVQVAQCRGSHARPLTDDDLGVKFRGQANMVLSDTASEDLLGQCWHLQDMDDVGEMGKRFFQGSQLAGP